LGKGAELNINTKKQFTQNSVQSQRIVYYVTVDCKEIVAGFAELQSQNVILQQKVCNVLIIVQRSIAK
jgi:hypothetical protein